MNIVAKNIITMFEDVRTSTINRLKLVPKGFENWRIEEDKMSFADIAQHLAECDYWLIDKINDPSLVSIKGCSNIVTIQTRKEYNKLISNLESSLELKLLAVKQLTLWDFDKLYFDDRFGKEVSLWYVIMRGNVDHEIHHRGQLSVYMQMMEKSS